ncbi:MAG: hypothetical protein U0931_28445 [Vulcanimicrobiota bacterium]
MSDLLEQFEGTLGRLKAMGVRGQEISTQVDSLRSRTEQDHSQFKSHSSNLLPRAQALVNKLRDSRDQLQTTFAATLNQITVFREDVQDLDKECRNEGQLLFDALNALQQEHSNLQQEADELLKAHQNTIQDHAIQAQDGLQALAPQLVQMDSNLRDKVMPNLLNLAGQLVEETGKTMQKVQHEIIPDLQNKSRALEQHAGQNAEQFRAQAHQLTAEIEGKTQALMQNAAKAAQKIHENSNQKLLALAGEIDLCFTSFTSLMQEIGRVMKGFHGTKRIAMSSLDLIIEIVDELVTIVNQLAEEG